MTTRIKLRQDGDVFETLLLDQRTDFGPEVRQEDAPLCESDRSVAIDVPTDHCSACTSSIAELLGLEEHEVERIKRWREAAEMTPDERRENNMTSAELGKILDKIAEQLDAGEADCDHDAIRVVVEVEPTP